MTRTTMRTHPAGALGIEQVGETVRLGGWVHRRRNLGGLVFFDLRDREGIVQVAFGPDWCSEEILARARETGHENVVLVEGKVHARPEDAQNPEMKTGQVEVHATGFEIVGPAETPPIPVWRTKGEDPPSEELRLQYRHLDLRRPELQANLRLRHRLLQTARRTMSDLDFFEIETPILTKPTPEGARDYLVPSRVHQGQFYALPQSPQIYKQVLMASGIDRYFQIARCFRDEDLRADRQPEFTQIDIEASFVAAEDIYGVVEAVLAALWSEAGKPTETPFRRMSFDEAMESYGTDKPDLRYGFEIEDVSDWVRGRGFAPFDAALEESGTRIRAVAAPGGAELSRKELDGLTSLVKKHGLTGLAVLKRKGDELTGPLAKLEGISTASCKLSDGDLLLVAAGPDRFTSPALDAVRQALIGRLKPKPGAEHAFAWVENFPLFQENEEGVWEPAHHPFTAPHPEDVQDFMAGKNESVRAQHYDVVYNGNELGSGSIRIVDPVVQLKVLNTLGIDQDDAERRFGFLLRALKGGAPPHGGFALGFDRIVMLLAGADNLRDVIAFPKTTAARALFEESPTDVRPEELRDLGLGLLK